MHASSCRNRRSGASAHAARPRLEFCSGSVCPAWPRARVRWGSGRTAAGTAPHATGGGVSVQPPSAFHLSSSELNSLRGPCLPLSHHAPLLAPAASRGTSSPSPPLHPRQAWSASARSPRMPVLPPPSGPRSPPVLCVLSASPRPAACPPVCRLVASEAEGALSQACALPAALPPHSEAGAPTLGSPAAVPSPSCRSYRPGLAHTLTL